MKTGDMPHLFVRAGLSVQQEPLHYTQCGLDNVLLLNGFDRLDETGRISIHDIDGLHFAIAMNIVLQRKAPTGRELRFLRYEMDMTQAGLASVLSVSDQTVARWEKGETSFDGLAVTAVRLLFVDQAPKEMRDRYMHSSMIETLKELVEVDDIGKEISFRYENDMWAA